MNSPSYLIRASFFCLYILGVVLPIQLKAKPRALSPNDFGFSSARSGEQRYEAIYKTHCMAIQQGAMVDYNGLTVIDLTIPSNAKSIPLTNTNDFSGVTFRVQNNSKNIFLFEKRDELHAVKVKKRAIKRGRYPFLIKKNKGRVLLVVEDKNPWVEIRKGFDYGVTRKDALLIENGVALQTPIYPYSSKYSIPQAYYRVVDNEPVSISNVSLERQKGSTKITYLLNIVNQVDVRIENVVISTPESTLTGDACLRMENCVGVILSNVNINNTYSSKTAYGYGVNLINVTDLKIDHFSGYGEWGVFGNLFINSASLTNSKMNRFDVHCYGKDISFENCAFKGMNNQFSSMSGNLTFTNCSFSDFIPVSLEASYNAYTAFDIYFNNCEIRTTSTRHALVNSGVIDDAVNSRYELTSLCWPNVYINGLRVTAGYGANPLYVFSCRGNVQARLIEYISDIRIEDLVYTVDKEAGQIKTLELCNKPVETAVPLNLSLTNVRTSPVAQNIRTSQTPRTGRLIINMRAKNGKQNKTHVNDNSFEIIIQ